MHYLAGSVVQTDVHHPTDNTLLWDVVRVVTRLVLRLSAAVQQRIQGFRNRTRAARRRMQEIQRMTPKERHQRQVEKYRELIGIAEEVGDRAGKVVKQTRVRRERWGSTAGVKPARKLVHSTPYQPNQPPSHPNSTPLLTIF